MFSFIVADFLYGVCFYNEHWKQFYLEELI